MRALMSQFTLAHSVRQLSEVSDRYCRTAMSSMLALVVAALPVGCGDEGPAIDAKFQQITFSEAPLPDVDQTSATVFAQASSGLPVTYSSLTPNTCSVDEQSGLVTGEASGTCTIEADQLGNTEFGPVRPVTQSITFRFSDSLRFDSTLSLGLYDTGTVRAVDTSGDSITYATTTPLACSIDGETGLVVAFSIGTCIVVATAGASVVTQSISIGAPSAASAPSAPSGVTATSPGAANSVTILSQSIASGGSPITEYSVTSIPAGITAKNAALPVTVTCPSGCAGYAFSLIATNAIGSSPPSAVADVITTYGVTAVFREPDTQPNDSMFVGQYEFDATKRTVSGLSGRLSEAMTGGSSPYPNDTMNWLTLDYQLSVRPMAVGDVNGLLVTTFRLATTNTLASDPAFGGTDGWSPGTGMGLYYGYPSTNPGNAYVMVFVNTQNPLATPTAAELDMLAYTDCAPGGMMGATCMTGTSIAGYGSLGTMSGYPTSQVTVQQ